MRVLIVQHVSAEGPGLLQEVFSRQGWEPDLRCMDTPGTTLPVSLDGYHAYVILGGPMGAYEEDVYPYLYQVQRLIRQAVSAKIPTLGVCLGGQLIARALGAHVGPNRVREIGWYPVSLTEAGKGDPLFTGLPPEFLVFQWHQDTFDLPKGARLLARGESCLHQGFVYGDCAWALQFHLEVTPDMVTHWAEIYAAELVDFAGPTAVEDLVRETHGQWEKMRIFREQFFKNIEMVLRGKSF